jgi:hypothetical protein
VQALSAGFVATICSNPPDIVATRTMASVATLKSSNREVCADMEERIAGILQGRIPT